MAGLALPLIISAAALLYPPVLRPRAPSPLACAGSARELVDACAEDQECNVGQAAYEIKETLRQQQVLSVPRLRHVTDWLDVEPLPTHYQGGCLTDIETLQEEECVVPEPENNVFVDDSSVVLKEVALRADAKALDGMTAYHAAGPREEVFFAGEEVKAAIVTCGGLCPGLNTVVKELVNCLRSQYGVDEVYGIKNGYMGFYSKEYLKLTQADVSTIHRQGGSMLGSSRGGHDTDKICDAIEKAGINLVFTIGGDGTMKGSDALAMEFIRRQSKVVVAHVPKTIDNDIPLLDSTFGFGTAVQEATKAIHVARDEAVAYPDGVGLVNLMGRHSGFIAAHASIAARGVDCCLVPEVPFELEGEGGLLRYIESRIAKQGHCVVVVAEGAGQELLAAKESGVDASGNAKMGEIGRFLKTTIGAHFKAKGRDASVKYVDPSYMVRATPASAADNILCLQLAHDAVHGAFAGYTSFMAGRVNNRGVYIPLGVATGRNVIQPGGNFWQQLVYATGQPNWGATEAKANDGGSGADEVVMGY